MTITKAKSYQDYGRLGGQATKARYGREFFVHIGRRGGRPRAQTLNQIKAATSSRAQFQENGGKRLPNSLRELRELWELRNKNGELGSLAAPSPPERSVIEV